MIDSSNKYIGPLTIKSSHSYKETITFEKFKHMKENRDKFYIRANNGRNYVQIKIF